MAREFSESDFETSVIKSDKGSVVDFWAPWCGPCRVMGPVIDGLASRFDGRFNIGKVNVDDNPNLAAKYGIASIPTILFFKNGAVVYTHSGLTSDTELIKLIEQYL